MSVCPLSHWMQHLLTSQTPAQFSCRKARSTVAARTVPTDQPQHYLACSPLVRKMPTLSAQFSVLFSGGCSVMILSPPDGNLPTSSLTAHPKPAVAKNATPVGFSRNPVHFSDNAAAYYCHQDFTNWHHLSIQLRTLGFVSASTDPPRRPG